MNHQIKKWNFLRILSHLIIIWLASYLIFLIASSEEVYFQIKYLVNMDLGLYLAVDLLNLFLVLGLFQDIVLPYYSLEQFIRIRCQKKTFYLLLLQQYFLFIGEFLVLNGLSDYLIMRHISFQLIFINLILILIMAHLVILFIKNSDWNYVLSVLLVFLFRYLMMLSL